MSTTIAFFIIFAVLIFVGYKTWQEIMDEKKTNCNQDCNQGRNCKCECSDEDGGISYAD